MVPSKPIWMQSLLQSSLPSFLKFQTAQSSGVSIRICKGTCAVVTHSLRLSRRPRPTRGYLERCSDSLLRDRAAPVRTIIAGTRGRMQPRCQQKHPSYDPNVGAARDHAVDRRLVELRVDAGQAPAAAPALAVRDQRRVGRRVVGKRDRPAHLLGCPEAGIAVVRRRRRR